MKRNPRKVGLVLFVTSGLAVISYEHLPLWRNLRVNTPFGGELSLRSGVQVPTNEWVRIDGLNVELIVEGDLRDKYGVAPIKITSKKRRGEAVEIWIVKSESD